MAMDVDRRVRELLTSVLKIEIPPDGDLLRAETAPWDSLKHMELMFAIEDEFEVELDEADFPKLDSLSALVERLS